MLAEITFIYRQYLNMNDRLVPLRLGNQLAAQGLLGESKWRMLVCLAKLANFLVSIYQFLVSHCENVVPGICNVPCGN